jgi:malonyl-CoA decarboxylase
MSGLTSQKIGGTASDSPGVAGFLRSIITVGRELLSSRGTNPIATATGLTEQCHQLLHHRGEASGLALADEVNKAYLHLDESQQLLFFQSLNQEFAVDPTQVIAAANHYREQPNHDTLIQVTKAVEAPRVRLFRRMNMAPGGTTALVKLRGDLLKILQQHPELKAVDADLKHQFISWFNKGFLELRAIDWNSPALVLERIIKYESVHAINGWDDLRSRLRGDRLCYAFFHPALPNDPLVFVEIALTRGIPTAISPLLDLSRETDPNADFDTVVFYSISNCHPGLAGISFGNFLIKQVVEEISKRHAQAKTYVTLSPVPGFHRWLSETASEHGVDAAQIQAMAKSQGENAPIASRDVALRLCAHYLINEKSGHLAMDPVARFHLGNGARLAGIHWAADLSEKGLKQSAGIMVNYHYDISAIERNHDAYFDRGEIAVTKGINRLLS